jgi:hypothetical protein
VEAGSGKHHFDYGTELRLERLRYSIDTLLDDIWEHPVTAEMLKKAAPDMCENPMIK